MAEQEVGLRLSLKERRETARGLDDVDSRLAKIGRTSEKSGRQAAAGARGIERLTGGIRTLGRVTTTALVAGVAAAGYTAVKVTQSAIAEASNLNESLNAVNVSYGKQARAVKKLGRQAAASLGLSNVEFNGLAVRFSSFAKTIAGPKGGKAVVTTLDDLTTRASDFASVMNLEVSDAAELFQSGLAGESEPLRAYGIDVSAASVSAYAYANGIAEAGSQLTSAQKVQATYGSLMAQTAQTAGDFSKTSDQLANSQRILGARWDNAKAKLGKGLLPIMTGAVRFLNRDGIPAFLRFADRFNEDGVPAIQRFIDKAKPLAREVLPAVKTTLGTVRDVAADLAPKIQAVVGAFNDMPDWAKTALITGGGAAAVGSKLGLGKLAKGGLSLATKAKPLPVFVVNNGVGGGPGNKVKTVAKTAAATGAGAGGVAALGAVAAAAALAAGPIIAQKTRRQAFGDERIDRMERNSASQQSALRRDVSSHMGVAEMQGPALGISQYVEAMNQATRSKTADYFKAIEGGVYKTDTAVRTATSNTKVLGDTLGVVGRLRVVPVIDANTAAAEAKVARLLARMGPILTFGVSTVAAAPTPTQLVQQPAGGRGRMMPRSPVGRTEPAPDASPGGGGGWVGGKQTINVPVYLDGKLVAESVLEHVDGMRARS